MMKHAGLRIAQGPIAMPAGPAAVNPSNAGLSPNRPPNLDDVRREMERMINDKFPGRQDFAATVQNVANSNTEATPRQTPYVPDAGVEEVRLVDDDGNEQYVRNNKGMWEFRTGLGESTGLQMTTEEAMKHMERYPEDQRRRACQIMRVDLPTVETDPTGYVSPEELALAESGTAEDTLTATKAAIDDEALKGRLIKPKLEGADASTELRIGDKFWSFGDEVHQGKITRDELDNITLTAGLTEAQKEKILAGKKAPRVKAVTEGDITYLPFSERKGDKVIKQIDKFDDNLMYGRYNWDSVKAGREHPQQLLEKKMTKWQKEEEERLRPITEKHKLEVLKTMASDPKVITTKAGTPHLVTALPKGVKVKVGQTPAQMYKTKEALEAVLTARVNDKSLTKDEKKQIMQVWDDREKFAEKKLKESGFKTWTDYAKQATIEKAQMRKDPMKAIDQKTENGYATYHYRMAETTKAIDNALGKDKNFIQRYFGWFTPENAREKLKTLQEYGDVFGQAGHMIANANVSVGQMKGYISNMSKIRQLEYDKAIADVDFKLKEHGLDKDEKTQLQEHRRILLERKKREESMVSKEFDSSLLDREQNMARANHMRIQQEQQMQHEHELFMRGSQQKFTRAKMALDDEDLRLKTENTAIGRGLHSFGVIADNYIPGVTDHFQEIVGGAVHQGMNYLGAEAIEKLGVSKGEAQSMAAAAGGGGLLDVIGNTMSGLGVVGSMIPGANVVATPLALLGVGLKGISGVRQARARSRIRALQLAQAQAGVTAGAGAVPDTGAGINTAGSAAGASAAAT
jgi:hypothetical protein